MQQPAGPYPTMPAFPLTYSVEYPDRPLNRLSTGLRFLWIIPIAVIVSLIENAGPHSGGWWWIAWGGLLFAPLVLMILFRQKYPRWWFDWNLNLTKFLVRVTAYAELLRDEYPSTDEEQAAFVDFPYPDALRLNRWLPLVKWFLAIPHWIVLAFLYLGVFFALIIAWFAILFTGRYPLSLFMYVVGVNRWMLRVQAYAVLLITDQYPPFSLD
jgi:hypothetical protein